MSKALVAVFSASEGKVSLAVGKVFARALNADLHEILPREPYIRHRTI